MTAHNVGAFIGGLLSGAAVTYLLMKGYVLAYTRRLRREVDQLIENQEKELHNLISGAKRDIVQ